MDLKESSRIGDIKHKPPSEKPQFPLGSKTGIFDILKGIKLQHDNLLKIEKDLNVRHNIENCGYCQFINGNNNY